MSDAPVPSRGLAPSQSDEVFVPDEGRMHWTLSIYFSPEDVAGRAGRPLDRSAFRTMQAAHAPSLKLAQAIEPFFNDIADRARFDGAGEFLLASGEPELRVQFELPQTIRWSTEGQDFIATLRSLRPPDAVEQPPPSAEVRRFWFSHANRALSYHVSFAHALRLERDAAYYYFLSLLQKLPAPREFAKSPAAGAARHSVFDETTGIPSFDELKLSSAESSSPAPFWSVLMRWLVLDSDALFARAAEVEPTQGVNEKISTQAFLKRTLVPSSDVPGLDVPRSRSLFFFQDRRFFRRLLPTDPEGKAIARKEFVLDECFAPYREQVARSESEGVVLIGRPEPADDRPFVDGTWINTRPDYDALLNCPTGAQVFEAKGSNSEAQPIVSTADLERHAARGEAFQLYDVARLQSAQAYVLGPNQKEDEFWRNLGALKEVGSDTVRTLGLRRKQTPTKISRGASAARADCLDYLFLSGFNQNIIDWLNQEPSEILDSTDPIYPKEPSQFDEAFFVRFANHTSLITYAPKSRTLEVGAHHIGTCPYAFLVHSLALQNEMIVLDAEKRIGDASPALKDLATSKAEKETLHAAEDKVTEIRLRLQEDMSEYKAANIFRYDTERDVFDALERLRGIERRQATLESSAIYLDNLVRHAAVQRSRRLNVLLSLLGLTSLTSLCFDVATFHEDHPTMVFIQAWDGRALEFVFSNLGWGLTLFLVASVFSQRLRTLVGRFIERRTKA